MIFPNLLILTFLLLTQSVLPATIFEDVIKSDRDNNGLMALHFGFQTENGQQRSEDIKYNSSSLNLPNQSPGDIKSQKPVEYRGGYSFISADGYEYTVLYKANKNGFQPYVTAQKIVQEKN